jgi:hypothetical protein
MLVQAGADVSITRPAVSDLEEKEGETETALTLALRNQEPKAAQVLLDHGADKTTFQRMTPPQRMDTFGDHRVLRMFFIAGVDLSACAGVDGETYEVRVRNLIGLYSTRGPSYACLVTNYAKIVAIFDGVRLFGSYREYILHDYKQLLRVRSLLARGRATIKSKHHPVIARLFGGTVASRGSPKRSRPLGRFAGVPDPIFWKVLEYYRLGDWRRPC